jgi:hypothetical protein
LSPAVISKKPLLVTKNLEPSNMMAVENIPHEKVLFFIYSLFLFNFE